MNKYYIETTLTLANSKSVQVHPGYIETNETQELWKFANQQHADMLKSKWDTAIIHATTEIYRKVGDV